MTEMDQVLLHVPSTSTLAEAFYPAHLSDTERPMLHSFLFHAHTLSLSLHPSPSVTLMFH